LRLSRDLRPLSRLRLRDDPIVTHVLICVVHRVCSVDGRVPDSVDAIARQITHRRCNLIRRDKDHIPTSTDVGLVAPSVLEAVLLVTDVYWVLGPVVDGTVAPSALVEVVLVPDQGELGVALGSETEHRIVLVDSHDDELVEVLSLFELELDALGLALGADLVGDEGFMDGRGDVDDELADVVVGACKEVFAQLALFEHHVVLLALPTGHHGLVVGSLGEVAVHTGTFEAGHLVGHFGGVFEKGLGRVGVAHRTDVVLGVGFCGHLNDLKIAKWTYFLKKTEGSFPREPHDGITRLASDDLHASLVFHEPETSVSAISTLSLIVATD
jgi:hypothetical protein